MVRTLGFHPSDGGFNSPMGHQSLDYQFMLGWLDGEATPLHGVICRFESYPEYHSFLNTVCSSAR